MSQLDDRLHFARQQMNEARWNYKVARRDLGWVNKLLNTGRFSDGDEIGPDLMLGLREFRKSVFSQLNRTRHALRKAIKQTERALMWVSKRRQYAVKNPVVLHQASPQTSGQGSYLFLEEAHPGNCHFQ